MSSQAFARLPGGGPAVPGAGRRGRRAAPRAWPGVSSRPCVAARALAVTSAVARRAMPVRPTRCAVTPLGHARPEQRGSTSCRIPGTPTAEPEGGLTIDCDCCALQETDACDDCVVSFLLGREPDDAVVIDADEARAMRMLERAGLVPTLRFSTRGLSAAGRAAAGLYRRRRRAGGALGEAPPARHQRLPSQGRRHPELPLGAVAPARPGLLRRAHRVVRRRRRRVRRRPGRAGRPHRAGARRASSSSRRRSRSSAVRACVRRHEVDLVLLDPALPLGLLGPTARRALRRHPPRRRGHGARPDPRRTRRAGPRAREARASIVSAGGYPAAEALPCRAGPHGAGGRDPPGRRHGRPSPRCTAAERRAARAPARPARPTARSWSA